VTLGTFRFVHSFLLSLAARYVCATASPDEASIGASHNRGSSGPGSGARSDWKCVQWSRRVCQIREPTAPEQAGRGAALICRELASGEGHRFLGGGAGLPPLASDATWPTAGPIVCRRPGSVRSPPWIRHASSVRRPQIVAPPTFSRRAAYSLVAVAYPSASR
jgi:hypothetical protein